jgi:hypothetical protein
VKDASSQSRVASALRNMLSDGVGGETYRAVALGFDRDLPRTLGAIPPASPLDEVLDEFRKRTPIAEELPLFAFVTLTAQYLAECGVCVKIPRGRAFMDLYTVVCAGSGEMKTFSTKRLVQSISDLWSPRMLKEPGSSRGFLDEMVENDGKPVLWHCDEWGKFWERAKSETGPHAETPRMLLKFYDKDGYTKRLKTELVEVKQPYLSIFGTTVLKGLENQIRPDDWDSGLVQRFGFVIAHPPRCPDRDWRRREARWLPVSQERLKKAWRRMTRNSAALRNPEWTMTRGADQAYGILWENLAVEGLGQQFVRRIAFRALTYAAVFHFICGKKTGKIDAEDVGWAGRLAMFHLADLKFLLGENAASKLEKMLAIGEIERRRRGVCFAPRDLKMRLRDKLGSPEETLGLYLAVIRNAFKRGAKDLPPDEAVFERTGHHIDPSIVDGLLTEDFNNENGDE